MDLRNGNCLELMKTLPDKSIDLFICDLPYGETNCKWDSKIDMVEFWLEFKRLRKSKRTACIHFCSTKFGYTLIKSNEKMFKMDMVWKKRNKTGGLQSRHRPMRNHEMVYFFYEQAPKYNRDKYHKRIQAKLPIIKDDKQIMGKGYDVGKQPPFNSSKYFDPVNPVSVVEEADANKATIYKGRKKGNKDPLGMDAEFKKMPFKNQFDPKLPASVLEEKPKKKLRDKTNSTRAKEGKDIFGNNDTNVKPFNYDPPNPASVVEEDETIYNKNTVGWSSSENNKTYLKQNPGFTPRQPASVLEEADVYGETKKQRKKRREKGDSNFEPPNPASVINEVEKTTYGISKDNCLKSRKNGFGNNGFKPPNPASVLEEEQNPLCYNQKKFKDGGHCGRLNNDGSYKMPFEPPNPASVVDEKDEFGWDKSVVKEKGTKFKGGNFEPTNPASVLEGEPKSMFESTKVFIGKRHHQTEKPQDILEFFLKYWSDEGDTILDPTMGSGSTGVACKKLNRKFIGFELDETIFKVAEKRCTID